MRADGWRVLRAANTGVRVTSGNEATCHVPGREQGELFQMGNHIRSHPVTSGHIRSHPVTSGHIRLHPVTAGHGRLQPEARLRLEVEGCRRLQVARLECGRALCVGRDARHLGAARDLGRDHTARFAAFHVL